jgi:hypothetical protein
MAMRFKVLKSDQSVRQNISTIQRGVLVENYRTNFVLPIHSPLPGIAAAFGLQMEHDIVNDLMVQKKKYKLTGVPATRR